MADLSGGRMVIEEMHDMRRSEMVRKRSEIHRFLGSGGYKYRDMIGKNRQGGCEGGERRREDKRLANWRCSGDL
jgi:hypothetical protein